jgi:hypothetical protein
VASQPHVPLTVRQEGRDVRATTGRLNFLFPGSSARIIGETYNHLIPKADSHFALRWNAHDGPNIGPGAFYEITEEITLHWMYLHAINQQTLEISNADWEHPQTRRIIQSGVRRNLQGGPEAEAYLCARLMGLSDTEYRNWREADDTFLSIW